MMKCETTKRNLYGELDFESVTGLVEMQILLFFLQLLFWLDLDFVHQVSNEHR
jgi:hypothetical protein